MGIYAKLLREQAVIDKKLFWDIPENKISMLSESTILERILNYGDINQFKIVTSDMKNFEKVYKHITRKSRNNLFPIVVNYVELYIKNNS